MWFKKGEHRLFGGDSKLIPTLERDLPQRFPVIDLALLSVNGLQVHGKPVVMNDQEAAKLAGELHAGVAVPMHYMFHGGASTVKFLSYHGTAAGFANAAGTLAPHTIVRILPPGQTLPIVHVADFHIRRSCSGASPNHVATKDYGRAYAAAIPNAEFEIVVEAGHLPWLEQPAATFTVLDRACRFPRAIEASILGKGTLTGAAGIAPERAMGAIAEALVATAVGLVVAIPAVAVFNYFQGLLNAALANADTLGHLLLTHMQGERAASLVDIPSNTRTRRPSRRRESSRGRQPHRLADLQRPSRADVSGPRTLRSLGSAGK